MSEPSIPEALVEAMFATVAAATAEPTTDEMEEMLAAALAYRDAEGRRQVYLRDEVEAILAKSYGVDITAFVRKVLDG